MGKGRTEEQDVKVLGLLHDRYSRASDHDQPVLREMEQCRLFYRGDQWLDMDNNAFDEAGDEEWRVRLTVNKLPAAVDSAIATFLSQKPIIVTTSPTDDTDDREAAKVSEHVIMHYWDEKDIQDIKLYDLCQWMFTCGTAFLRPRWDTFVGRNIPLYEKDEGGMDTDVVQEMVREGDLEVDVIDSFSLRPEPGCTDIGDAAWVIVTENMLRDDIEARFEIDLSEKEASVEDGDGLGDNMSREKFSPTRLDQYRETPERIFVHTMYDRPTLKNPKGRVVYATSTLVLRVDSELPVKIGDDYVIPIVKFDNLSLPGEFWSTSIVSQSIPLQAAYNRLRSQIIENRNLMSRPQWIAPDGALDEDVMRAEPGLVIPFDHIASGGIAPRQAEVYHTDPAHISELGLIINDMDDITSRHDVSLGRQSSDITSGKHAEQMKGADDSRYQGSIRMFEKKLAHFARLMLCIIKKHVHTERPLKIMGDSRSYEVRYFTENDITDRANIKFEISSQLPWDRDAMRQTAVWMYSQKLLDKDGLLERLNWPSMRGLYECDQQHRLNARNENEQLESRFLRPFPSDDHKIHNDEHDKTLTDPRNRDQFQGERQQMEQFEKAEKQAKKMQAPPPQKPNLLYFNLIKHCEMHRKGSGEGAPEKPQERIAINISSKDLPPETSKKIAESVSGGPGGGQPVGGSKKGGGKPDNKGGADGLSKKMGSPPGGLSGEMYGQPGEGEGQLP